MKTTIYRGEIFPKLSHTFPKHGETFPKLREPFPKHGETFPKLREPFPKLGEPFPKHGEPFPVQKETVPEWGNVILLVELELHHPGQTVPERGEGIPLITNHNSLIIKKAIL